MSDLTVEGETEALLGALERHEVPDGIVRASAMMAAAVSYLARVAGPSEVLALLRADADTVAAHMAADALLTMPSPAGLH